MSKPGLISPNFTLNSGASKPVERPSLLTQTRMEILGLALLGASELNAFDMFSKFYDTVELGKNNFFMLITFIVAFFSMALLGFCVIRLRAYYGSSAIGAARTGAYIGFLSGLGIWIIVLVFALAGIGIERLVPAMTAAWHVDRLGAYLIFFFGLVGAYSLCGAILGFTSGIWRKIF